MNLWNETKSVPISREMIWAAYKKVKANKGSAGVDEISMEEFDAERSKHLCKLWNRMASGSYFPPPVKEVEIPKKDGKVRKLGVPTIADRIGQMAKKNQDFIPIPEPTVVFTVKLGPTLIKRVKAIASSMGVSISMVVKMALDEFLSKPDHGEKKETS